MTQAKAPRARAGAAVAVPPTPPTPEESLARLAEAQRELAGHRLAPLKALVEQVEHADMAKIADTMAAVVPLMPEGMVRDNFTQVAIVLRTLPANVLVALQAAQAAAAPPASI